MKKTFIFYSIVLLFGFFSYSQSTVSGFAEVNYNTFSHTKLSDFQQQLLNDIDEVSLRVNDDFGANVGFSGGIKVEEIKTQFFVSYNSTGGKISYSDFSGTIRLTQLLEAYSVGGEYHLELSRNDSQGVFNLGLRGFVNLTKLGLDSYSEITNVTSSESINFNSVDFGVGFRFIYDIPISVVFLRLHMGYDLLLGGPLQFSENSDATLEDNQGDAIKAGWSGFRSGIGVVIPF